MARELLPGESLVVRVQRHWIVLARSLVVPVLLLVVALVIEVAVSLPAEARLLLLLAALAVAGAWMIVAWIRWSSTSLTVTDHRVVLETGVFSRATKVIPLDRVQDVSTRQSLLGRIFGYGTVEIDAAGAAGTEVLDHVPQPHLLRDQVFAVSESLRRTTAI
jgi:uncharacterized membrane protein YdbT with pleckstrin-like domain